jgi:hypothetical protein
VKDPEGANAQIEAKLDIVIRLLALSAISHHHSLRDRAISLQRAGLSPKEIAKLCGLHPVWMTPA